MSARPQIKYVHTDRTIDSRTGQEGRRSARRFQTDPQAVECRTPRKANPRQHGREPPDASRGGEQGADQSRGQSAVNRNQHRPPDGEPAGARAPARSKAARRYMLAYAGRQVRFGPIVFWAVVGTLTIMAAWSVVTATYFAFHDEVIAGLIARQADLQIAYEDRLAEMRARVDRIITRQLVNSEQVGEKLELVLRRQSMLEKRASTLSSLSEPSATGSTKAGVRYSSASDDTPMPRKRSRARAGHDRQTFLYPSVPTITPPGGNAELDGKLTRLESALDRIEQRQTVSLNRLEESYGTKVRKVRSALAEIGVGPAKRAEAGVGGPYVPVKVSANTDDFERQVHRILFARTQLERLNKTLAIMPIRRPVSGAIDVSSTFGMRDDPFLRRPAFHTGIDFRGDTGDAVRATGNGVVVSAGWSGGYGRMVEINHGHGLITRYGHLSKIVVQVGQMVKIGQVVGKMGSTGRSTGPHLHYETRVDGDAVDPQRFLRAGRRMGSL
jgi:murein DD-endopeptidase MepM/ murein hydrolase activator NlpD